MDKIKNLILPVLIETANKYVQAKEEEYRNENEQFRRKVISSVKGCCRDFFMFSIIAALAITGFLFLKKNE
jgi:hypothetical protein